MFLNYSRKNTELNMKKLQIGIVGTGFITDFHYKAFKKNRNAAIIGMCHTYESKHPKYHEKQESFLKKCKKLTILFNRILVIWFQTPILML